MSRRLPEDELIRTYRDTIRPLYAYVSRRVGGDRSLAEDLVQDTWMRALDAWPRNGVPDEPLAWLLRVARNTLISHFRRVRPQPVDPALLDLEAATFSADAPDTAARCQLGTLAVETDARRPARSVLFRRQVRARNRRGTIVVRTRG